MGGPDEGNGMMHPNCRCRLNRLTPIRYKKKEEPKYSVLASQIEDKSTGSDDARFNAVRIANYVPDEDTKGIKNITIVDSLGRVKRGVILGQYEAENTVEGVKQGKITVRSSVLTGDENKARRIIFHEIGHHVERYRTSKEFLEWYEFYTENKDIMPSDNAKINHSEGFAECYALFHDESSEFIPKIHDWFTEHGYQRRK
jgi:hypothetical protein